MFEVSHHTPYREASHLDQGTTDDCTQYMITTQTCTIFKHFKNKPYYYRFTNILPSIYTQF
jgi:hypothetical protein